jgi:flagellar protein FliO/FliZ
MYTNIIGTQQIVITAAFLGVMILILIVLRKKSTVIRASMKGGKRIVVIEDSAVSPTERLRLVKIDGSEFVMVSAKGHAPSLMLLNNDHDKSKLRKNSQNDDTDDADTMHAAMENSMDAQHINSKLFAAEEAPSHGGNRKLTTSDDQQQAFAQTFQSWRQQNAAR